LFFLEEKTGPGGNSLQRVDFANAQRAILPWMLPFGDGISRPAGLGFLAWGKCRLMSRTGGNAIKNVNGNGDCVMRRALAAAIGFAALGMAPALAADLPAQTYSKTPVWIPAVYDWSGFYTGLNGGWGTSHKCWDSLSPAGVFIGSEGCHDATGGFGGAQIGYRWGVGTGPVSTAPTRAS
jgi:hypothetical protein